jgi:hypothetical protein
MLARVIGKDAMSAGYFPGVELLWSEPKTVREN